MDLGWALHQGYLVSVSFVLLQSCEIVVASKLGLMCSSRRAVRPAGPWFRLLAAAAVLLCCSTANAISGPLYNAIVSNIESRIIAPAPSMAATLVRLAFHDCLGAGGCDGCIDTKLFANAGMDGAVDTLEGFFNGTIMSLKPSEVSRAGA